MEGAVSLLVDPQREFLPFSLCSSALHINASILYRYQIFLVQVRLIWHTLTSEMINGLQTNTFFASVLILPPSMVNAVWLRLLVGAAVSDTAHPRVCLSIFFLLNLQFNPVTWAFPKEYVLFKKISCRTPTNTPERSSILTYTSEKDAWSYQRFLLSQYIYIWAVRYWTCLRHNGLFIIRNGRPVSHHLAKRRLDRISMAIISRSLLVLSKISARP